MTRLLEHFTDRRVDTGEATIRARVGGAGPPLLLLHGFPQTHLCWHRVAPALAAHFTVVLTDLRGYGDSSKPPGTPPGAPLGADAHAAYSKRAMARDQVAVMRALGYERFHVVGHDRGGRVAHRLALDHPAAVDRWAVLDIAPTLAMYERTDQAFATAYYHWFFLAQPFDLPERLIGADPAYYVRRTLAAWGRTPDAFADPAGGAALAEYVRCFADPAAIHAACEDYRAAAGVDLAHDRADRGRRVGAPLLALWGAPGTVGRMFDVLALWRACAQDVRGAALPCGHFLPEERPDAVLAALVPFLGG